MRLCNGALGNEDALFFIFTMKMLPLFCILWCRETRVLWNYWPRYERTSSPTNMDRIKGKQANQRALHTRLRNEAGLLIESSQVIAPALRVVHERLKNFQGRFTRAQRTTGGIPRGWPNSWEILISLRVWRLRSNNDVPSLVSHQATSAWNYDGLRPTDTQQ